MPRSVKYGQYLTVCGLVNWRASAFLRSGSRLLKLNLQNRTLILCYPPLQWWTNTPTSTTDMDHKERWEIERRI